ncbi:hypothetical protein PR202_gb21399 [Eleusine coracana subsp. coracana]|uniref:Uncharacterized protein n=1 Tax=Eleusine coracana subsp. coracana TaxID=191504 RepID=A0AAV5FEN0_ELECO|nr:hypothetical protein PR202_gb21399 [Eleusine coracana subsp. coracana]
MPGALCSRAPALTRPAASAAWHRVPPPAWLRSSPGPAPPCPGRALPLPASRLAALAYRLGTASRRLAPPRRRASKRDPAAASRSCSRDPSGLSLEMESNRGKTGRKLKLREYLVLG